MLKFLPFLEKKTTEINEEKFLSSVLCLPAIASSKINT